MIWQRIDRHHVFIICVPDPVQKEEKPIMYTIVNGAINISQGQESDIRILKRKSLQKSEKRKFYSKAQ